MKDDEERDEALIAEVVEAYEPVGQLAPTQGKITFTQRSADFPITPMLNTEIETLVEAAKAGDQVAFGLFTATAASAASLAFSMLAVTWTPVVGAVYAGALIALTLSAINYGARWWQSRTANTKLVEAVKKRAGLP